MHVDISGGMVMLLGMGIVFFGLICLILITILMSVVVRAMAGRKKAKQTEELPVAQSAAPAPAPIANRPQFVAAIASAIAAYMGTDLDGLRIHSIRRVGEDTERGQFVAAVSAAIAVEMGTEPDGLRIHSIKRV